MEVKHTIIDPAFKSWHKAHQPCFAVVITHMVVGGVGAWEGGGGGGGEGGEVGVREIHEKIMAKK